MVFTHVFDDCITLPIFVATEDAEVHAVIASLLSWDVFRSEGSGEEFDWILFTIGLVTSQCIFIEEVAAKTALQIQTI